MFYTQRVVFVNIVELNDIVKFGAYENTKKPLQSKCLQWFWV